MKGTLAAAFIALAAISAGCHHQPVYPGVGSVFITTTPFDAEIIIDGVLYQQRTPARIDGLPVGRRSIALRHYGYKIWRQTVEISPGATKRLEVKLKPISPAIVGLVSTEQWGNDMVLEPQRSRLYVANNTGTKLSVYQASGGLVAKIGDIELGHPQYLVAAGANGKGLAVTMEDSIMVLDLNWNQVVARLRPGRTKYTSVDISPDGRWGVLAGRDSSLTVVDMAGDSLLYVQRLAACL